MLREARAEVAAAAARSRMTENELNLRLRESYAQLTIALATSRALQTEIQKSLTDAKRIVADYQQQFGGETFEAQGYIFEVLDMDRHRVDKDLVMPVKSATPPKG